MLYSDSESLLEQATTAQKTPTLGLVQPGAKASPRVRIPKLCTMSLTSTYHPLRKETEEKRHARRRNTTLYAVRTKGQHDFFPGELALPPFVGYVPTPYESTFVSKQT